MKIKKNIMVDGTGLTILVSTSEQMFAKTAHREGATPGINPGTCRN